MSNIINVKEERNVLSFEGEVFNLVANSTNFYLKFELDSEWAQNSIITAIFNFDGKYEYVELDEERMCQIPPTNASKVWFCITAEPDDFSKLSSTILSLDVEETGNTNLENVEFYQNAHASLMGIIQRLLTGEGLRAEYANIANVSQTQVSLTGDEDISGVKNFIGQITQNSYPVVDSSEYSKPNYIVNSDFSINQKSKLTYKREGTDLYTADRWYLCNGNGTFKVTTKTLTGLDETEPTILCQWIDRGWDLFLGKTVTCSVTINGVRKSATITLGESHDEVAIHNLFETDGCLVRIYIPTTANTLGVQFLVENGTAVVLDNIKFEISKYETKYDKPIREEELRKCMRFYQKLLPAGVGYSEDDTTIYFFVPTVVPLRTFNNVVIKNAPEVLINGALVKATNIITGLKQDNAISLMIKDFPCEANKEYTVVHGTIFVDAEYYV